MKYPDLNSANSYLVTIEWRKYFWVFDLFGSFIYYIRLNKKSLGIQPNIIWTILFAYESSWLFYYI